MYTGVHHAAHYTTQHMSEVSQLNEMHAVLVACKEENEKKRQEAGELAERIKDFEVDRKVEACNNCGLGSHNCDLFLITTYCQNTMIMKILILDVISLTTARILD